jgi:DNA-binding NarL/FixJ family response regulator
MRILIAEDQPKVRFALRVLLKRQSGYEIVGETTDAQELLNQLEATRPDVVLICWELPGLSSAGSLSALREMCPHLTVIALSGRHEARREALAAGADAFISKCEPPERLLIALEDCCSGEHPQKAA